MGCATLPFPRSMNPFVRTPCSTAPPPFKRSLPRPRTCLLGVHLTASPGMCNHKHSRRRRIFVHRLCEINEQHLSTLWTTATINRRLVPVFVPLHPTNPQNKSKGPTKPLRVNAIHLYNGARRAWTVSDLISKCPHIPFKPYAGQKWRRYLGSACDRRPLS